VSETPAYSVGCRLCVPAHACFSAPRPAGAGFPLLTLDLVLSPAQPAVRPRPHGRPPALAPVPGPPRGVAPGPADALRALRALPLNAPELSLCIPAPVRGMRQRLQPR